MKMYTHELTRLTLGRSLNLQTLENGGEQNLPPACSLAGV